MFYVYLVHYALLYSLQVDSIPKARVLRLCRKSLCTFFLPESRPVLKFAEHVVLMAKRDAFKARVTILGEKRFSNWCLIIPLRWINVSRFFPLNKSARLSRSQYEKAILLLTNLGTLLLLTVKTRHPTATYNQT